jgi:hypothetical protein
MNYLENTNQNNRLQDYDLAAKKLSANTARCLGCTNYSNPQFHNQKIKLSFLHSTKHPHHLKLTSSS